MKKENIELRVGAFVTAGVVLIMVAILMLGGVGGFFSRSVRYTAHFDNVDGLIGGAKVVLAGLQVGRVEGIEFDSNQRDVQVTLEVDPRYVEWIRTDSVVTLATQGMLGDKYLSITVGDETDVLPPGSQIPAGSGAGLSSVINKSDQLMSNLNSISSSLDRLLKQFDQKKSERIFEGLADTSKNLAQATRKLNEELNGLNLKATSQNLNSILSKVNNGTGTLGAMVNDPSLYYDIKGLVGGANRNKIVRNLVRKTIKDSEEAEAKKEKQE